MLKPNLMLMRSLADLHEKLQLRPHADVGVASFLAPPTSVASSVGVALLAPPTSAATVVSAADALGSMARAVEAAGSFSFFSSPPSGCLLGSREVVCDRSLTSPCSNCSQPPRGMHSALDAENQAVVIEYRGERVAAFHIRGVTMICLPQVYEMFLKHMVGGLHTVYTKLKRLSIVPVACNVEQVRALRSVGAIQPGVNRCKLIAEGDFDALFEDCSSSCNRPGRPPKRQCSDDGQLSCSGSGGTKRAKSEEDDVSPFDVSSLPPSDAMDRSLASCGHPLLAYSQLTPSLLSQLLPSLTQQLVMQQLLASAAAVPLPRPAADLSATAEHARSAEDEAGMEREEEAETSTSSAGCTSTDFTAWPPTSAATEAFSSTAPQAIASSSTISSPALPCDQEEVKDDRLLRNGDESSDIQTQYPPSATAVPMPTARNRSSSELFCPSDTLALSASLTRLISLLECNIEALRSHGVSIEERENSRSREEQQRKRAEQAERELKQQKRRVARLRQHYREKQSDSQPR